MATITVTCPTCDSRLELDAAHRGQEVECGSCHEVFIAKPARPERDGREDEFDRDRDKDRDRDRRRRSSRRRSRRYEDDDDFDDDYYERRRHEAGESSGLGDASLIIGVVAVFVFWCPIVGATLTIVGLILGGARPAGEPQRHGHCRAGAERPLPDRLPRVRRHVGLSLTSPGEIPCGSA